MEQQKKLPKFISARTLLAAFGIRPKKARGQNFLTDQATASSCVKRAGIDPDHVVLEIGPGFGALTLPLSVAAKKVLAVEWDKNLVVVLEQQLKSMGVENVCVLQQDILKTDIAALSVQENSPLVVVGNLPYNISSQILIRLIKHRSVIIKAVVMLQKEMAQRVMAGPGKKKYGRISVITQYAADIRPLYTLGPSHFVPEPKVESQVLEFVFKKDWDIKNEDLFFAVVKAAFAKRRKTLKNTLSHSELPLSPAQAESALHQADINSSRRAETLSVAEFVALTRAVAKVWPEKQ